MEKTSPTLKTLFSSLPDNVKTLIFEFTDLKDFGNLSITSNDFNEILNDNSALWAKYICSDFLSITSTEAPAAFQQQFPPNNELKEGQIAYSGMVNSKSYIVSHYENKARLRTFLEPFLDEKTRTDFIKQLVHLFKDPNFPTPLHKKDAHYFPTNTPFQNFLTEVHFGIEGKTFFQTFRQKTLADLVKKMEKQLLETEVDPKELARLRWYLYENEFNEEKEEEDDEHEERILKNKEGLLAHKKLAREKTSEHIGYQSSPVDEPESATKVVSCVEELYYIIYAFVENFCAMICDYLTALKNPYLLLTEYSRLWNKFVLITIEFCQIFMPFANLFSKLYEDKCRHLPNFPEFSMWRLMLKIWIEEVHTPFGYYINESFRYVLKKVRNEEKLVEYNQKNMKNSSQGENKVPTETEEVPEEEFPDKADPTFKDKYNLDKQKLVQILKGYYDAIEDLSHNEYSIFYWDCDNDAKGAIKAALDTLIMQDTQSYYQECKKVVTYNKAYFKKLLKRDYELVGGIFGKLFNLDIKKYQTAILKDLLYKEFKAAIMEVENQTPNNKAENEEKKKALTAVNFEQAMRLLKSENHEYFTPEKREQIAKILAKDDNSFNSYLYHLMQEEEAIKNEEKEIEDMKHFRYIRGFTLTDIRFKSFFELGRVPSFQEVHMPGLQRLNTREELEDKGDRIEFL